MKRQISITVNRDTILDELLKTRDGVSDNDLDFACVIAVRDRLNEIITNGSVVNGDGIWLDDFSSFDVA